MLRGTAASLKRCPDTKPEFLRVLRRVRRDGASPVSTTSLFAEQFACCLQHGIGSEAELLLQILERRGCSKSVHADDAPFRSRVVRPAKGRTHFDRYPRGDIGRKYLIAVTLVLRGKQVPRGN